MSDVIQKDKIFTCCLHLVKLGYLSSGKKIVKRRHLCGGTRWRSCLKHCATNRNVAGSIPDGVSGIFHRHNRFGRTVALGSTQPLTEMSTGNFSWRVKVAGA
jgi:hypothetical protein